MKLILLLLFGLPATVLATSETREAISPLGFGENSQFYYNLTVPICKCIGKKCTYEEEDGKHDCVPSQPMAIDLTTDKIEKIEKVQEFKGEKPKLEKFPVKMENDTFDLIFSNNCNEAYETLSNKDKVTCEVFLVSKNSGKKKIKTFGFSPSPNHAVVALGFFRHPKQTKIAILIQESRYHSEGDSDYFQSIVGADLKKGFKK